MRQGKGRVYYVLERSFAGQRRAITLDARTEQEALAELALYERDPAGYRTARQVAAAEGTGPVRLDATEIAAFLAYLTAQGRTEAYRRDVRNALADWTGALAGRDLRQVSTRELRAMLKRWGGRKHRTIALKTCCTWLREREEGATLTAANDPSLGLTVPPPRPEKLTRSKGFDLGLVERLYSVIWRQDVRDVLRLRTCTGIHHTEIERIALGPSGGGAELRRVDDPSGIAGTVRFVHKRQTEHILSLDAGCFAAAERIVAAGARPKRSGKHTGPGGCPRTDTVEQVCDRACKRLGAADRLALGERDGEPPRFRPGDLRHTFATAAEEVGEPVYPKGRGAPGELISAVMGHTEQTTRAKFYRGVKVPPMIRIPVRLEHPDDPQCAGETGGLSAR